MNFFNEFFEKEQERIDIVSFYNRRWKNYIMSFHSHNRLEVMYIKKGKCIIEVPNQVYKLKEKQMIILEPNVPHKLIAEDLCHILNIEVAYVTKGGCLKGRELEFSYSVQASEKEEKQQGAIVFQNTDDLEFLLSGLLKELFDGDMNMVKEYLRLFCLKVDKIYYKEHLSCEQGRSNYVDAAMEYINENYSENLTIEDIAEHLNLSKVYIHKLFKKQTGKTIVEYITELKMEKAKELLATTDIPIIDICFLVGINSRQYFSSMFKKEIGMTPKTYRDMNNNKYRFDERADYDVTYTDNLQVGVRQKL